MSNKIIDDSALLSSLEKTKEYVDEADNKKVGYSEIVDGYLYMYTDSTKTVLLATLELPSGGISDVQVDGSSVVEDGVASISMADKMDAVNPTGSGAVSIGRKAGTTVGTNSVAIGTNVTASGAYSVALGQNSTASGVAATSVRGTASGDYSFAACGGFASDYGAAAIGTSCSASNSYAFAEGWQAYASGQYSHAEGKETRAKADGCHVEGVGTESSWLDRQTHIQGKYNVVTSGGYAHIVGNGTGSSARSNAHTLDWSGNTWYAGDIYLGGTGQTDSAAIKLAKTVLMTQEEYDLISEPADVIYFISDSKKVYIGTEEFI